MNFDFNTVQPMMQSFLLVLFRTGALVMSAPVLGAQTSSPRTRLMLAMALSLVLLPLVPPPAVTGFNLRLVVDVLGEVVIGIAMGLILQVAFETLLLAGELISFGSGLSFAQMVDPVRGTDSSALAALFSVFAMLIFLSLDGHLALIQVLADSFHSLPPGSPIPLAPLAQTVAGEGLRLFSGALQVALPGVIALLAVNLVLGVASRAAPSLNVFAVGLPISVLAGLLVIYLGLEVFADGWMEVVKGSFVLLNQIFGATDGGR
jgi:flagellar biosynthetic protein FliR